MYFLDIRQTPEYAAYMQKIGWEVGSILIQDRRAGQTSDPLSVSSGRSWYFVKKIPFFPFSFIKIHRPALDIPFASVRALAEKHRTLFVKISPSVPLCHSWFDQESQKQILKPVQDDKKNGKQPSEKRHDDPPAGGSSSDPNIVFPPPLIYKFYSPRKLHPDRDPMLATKTIWVDLTKNESQLLAAMRPKTRYNIKKAISYKLKAISYKGNDLKQNQIRDIYHLWQQNNRRNHLFTPRINDLIHLIKSFRDKCFVTTICHSLPANSRISNLGDSCFRRNDTPNQLLSFCLILLSPSTAFYWHNASTAKGRRLFAPTLCAWEAIRLSKKLGKKVFDFEGIFDDRYPKVFKNWKGFTRFKEGFINQSS